MNVVEIIPRLYEIDRRGDQAPQVGPVRRAERSLSSSVDQTAKRRRIALEHLHARDEAHDAQQFVIDARLKFPIWSIAREGQGLLGQKAHPGTPSPSGARLPDMCGYQRILDDCREATEEVLSAPTPYLQCPELGMDRHLDINICVELREHKIPHGSREIRKPYRRRLEGRVYDLLLDEADYLG